MIQTLPNVRGLKGLGRISETKARAQKEPKATAKAKPSGAKGQARPRQRTSKAAIKVGRQAPKEPKAKAKAKQGGAKGRKAALKMRQASPKGAQGKSKAQARPRQRTSKAALQLPLATQREANRTGPRPKGKRTESDRSRKDTKAARCAK